MASLGNMLVNLAKLFALLDVSLMFFHPSFQISTRFTYVFFVTIFTINLINNIAFFFVRNFVLQIIQIIIQTLQIIRFDNSLNKLACPRYVEHCNKFSSARIFISIGLIVPYTVQLFSSFLYLIVIKLDRISFSFKLRSNVPYFNLKELSATNFHCSTRKGSNG